MTARQSKAPAPEPATPKPAQAETITDFYKETAEAIQQSYKAPRAPLYVDMLNDASKAIISKIAQNIELQSATLGIQYGEYSKLSATQIKKLLTRYLPEYTKAGTDIKDRFNQVRTGQTEKDAQAYQRIRGQYIALAVHVSKALIALSYLDREAGNPPDINKLLPPDYVKKFLEKDVITHCDVCGEPITARDVEMSRTYCPDHGYLCDECRLKYLTEYRTHYEIEAFNRQQEYKAAQQRPSGTAAK